MIILSIIFYILILVSPVHISAQETCSFPNYCSPEPFCDEGFILDGTLPCDYDNEFCCRRIVEGPPEIPLPTCDPASVPVYGTSGPGCAVGVALPGCWPTSLHAISQDPCYSSDPQFCTYGAVRSHCYDYGDDGICEPRLYNAVDIPVSIGSRVYATHNGTASTVGYDPYGWGAYVVVSGSVTTIYAHLSQIFVNQGETVTQGKNIGLSGNSGFVYGNNGGAHLHYGIASSTPFITETLGDCTADACVSP